MALSYATLGPQNFELSPCRVSYKGVDLGGTLGNVVVKIESTMGEIKADQLGTTIIDRKVSGLKITIETEIAEVLLKANWKVIFPSYKLVTSGGNTAFYWDSAVGTSLRSLAGQLILHPLSHADTDLSDNILAYLATAEPKGDLTFSPSEQQKIKVMWDVYPDFTTLPPRFLFFGDPSVGLVNASAGAATGATGNTGNGSVGSIAVFNGYTETETVTLSCVTPGGTGVGKFFVSGSLSGAQGLATIGTAFTSNFISLNITAGGTAFVAGDSFAIATVAANYT